MTPILVFDIETVPDVAGLRRARLVPGELCDADVLDWFTQQRRAQAGRDFVPNYLPKIVANGCGSAGLDAMARLCGFPGKVGMDGSEVHAAVQQGRLDDVRRYCETDVMNTFLVYLRFRLLRGELTAGEYAQEVSLAREKIAGIDA